MRKRALDFEKPITELVDQLKKLKDNLRCQSLDCTTETRVLEREIVHRYREIFSDLNAWQRTELARHPDRPYMLDYLSRLTTDFIEIHGDRLFGDDPAIVTGLAVYHDMPVVLVGHQKGRGTTENLRRNFGMPNPEGFRKALRVMEMAANLGHPIISFIDTPGAYPGKGAEERGQAEAIARNLLIMSRLPVPIVTVVTGEGGSGGALGLSVGDRIIMQENAIYSVITPEGCAAILWKDAHMAPVAAESLKLTALDMAHLGIADEIIPEPLGGAHRNHDLAALILDNYIYKHIKELCNKSVNQIIRDRYFKFRRIGQLLEDSREH
ncbi:acetyl-CoA carboxylase carboxyltransferase subunit alpha [bacterium]|nr:acetyl-CoA carboxylase carboxyltransferase subunit alpha [candidate division CSSED10-310 bacterium]